MMVLRPNIQVTSLVCIYYRIQIIELQMRYKLIGVCHMPMEPAFDVGTSKILFEVGKELGYEIKNGGTVVTIEGPRFSSKAESNLMRLWGGDLVNMTICPEVCFLLNLK